MKRLAQQTQDINHLLKVRREKLAELQQNGRDPFQITKFDQTHHSLEVKGLYEVHETELLKDRQEPNVEGMDEEQAKEALKKDYETPLEPIPMQISRNLISVIFLVWKDLLSEQEQVRFLSMQRR